MSLLSSRNRVCCRRGTLVASTEILGNENRHSIAVSSATALHGYTSPAIALRPITSPGRWKPSTCSRPSRSML